MPKSKHRKNNCQPVFQTIELDIDSRFIDHVQQESQPAGWAVWIVVKNQDRFGHDLKVIPAFLDHDIFESYVAEKH